MNKKRYWLRGGIIFAVIHAVLSLIILSITGLNHTDNRDLVVLILIGKLGIGKIFGSWTILWCFTLYWFVVGGIIGWTYGKIKPARPNDTGRTSGNRNSSSIK